MREPTFASYEALARDLVGAIGPYLDRPYAFFGHCGAALPSYEITMQLSSTSYRRPSRLFVSSQVAPHQGPFGRFLLMQDHELKDEILSLMRQMGNEPPPSFVEVALSILRADVEANKRYRCTSPGRVPCPITAFGWDEDEEVDARLMVGWEDCGATTFRTLHGKHYEFLKAPATLLEAIHADLWSEVTEAASL